MTLPAPLTGKLQPVEPGHLADATREERQAEAWYLNSIGHSTREIAGAMGASLAQVRTWIRKEGQSRRSHLENIDEQVDRLVGALEGVVLDAWGSKRRLPDNSMAGPQYLKTVIDAVREIARLRGLDAPRGPMQSKKTEVVVRIGGEGTIPGAIDVGVRESE